MNVYPPPFHNLTSSTTFEVINPFLSSSFIMIISAIAFFVGLITLLLVLSTKNKDLTERKEKRLRKEKDEKNHTNSSQIHPKADVDKKEKFLEDIEAQTMIDYVEIAAILRYLLISGIIWSIVASFILTNVELGTHSPLGLVLRHNLNPYGERQLDDDRPMDPEGNPLTDWVINIGGNWSNNFTSGIIVPVYVFILGLLGGYLRHLHKSASKEKSWITDSTTKENKELMDEISRAILLDKIKEWSDKDKTLKERLESISKELYKNKEEKERTSDEFTSTTYAELSYIFLAPLLAAVVWFLLTQGDPKMNVYLLAAVSFAIGLVTKDITNGIVGFMKRLSFQK